MDPLTLISTRQTPQTEQAHPAQVRNSAGGYTFGLDDDARLRRFLILGTTGGTFYVGQKTLTKDNADVVLHLARTRGSEVVTTILDVSLAGRAPKPEPALFALAAVAGLGDDDSRRAAFDALDKVARTGTHLFLFVGYLRQFRGLGRGATRALRRWYEDKDPGPLGYQLVKYRQRGGWSHRDVLRLAHPPGADAAHRALYEWTVRGTDSDALPPIVRGFTLAQLDGADIPTLIGEYGLTWEMLPPAALALDSTWRALLDRGMPMTALLRNLARLTSLGVLKPGSPYNETVAAQLTGPAALKAARVHPLSVLVALRTYAGGASVRGSGEWVPVRQIVDALDAAFYASFGNLEPSGKSILLAVDVSGSMDWSNVAGLPITPREACAALALVTAATEPNYEVMAFSSQLVPVTLSPRQRLDDVMRAFAGIPYGSTDCAQPMLRALSTGLHVDLFVVLTDNETWAGSIHPHEALRRYREQVNPNARLAVVGMTSTGFSIADPSDPGQIDVVGFDTATPQLLTDFALGRV